MLIKQGEIYMPKELKNKRKWFQLLSDFSNGNQKGAEVVLEEGGYKNLNSCHSTLCTAIRRYGFNLSTVKQDGRLYLIKEIHS